ncbi:MAG: hypothetical protein QOJ81_1745 [Chloroflexota bacterium]|nr:hypothetical protein [Chloroflexota bacterium]
MPEYSLIELAKLADVTPRTIRYYIQQGLLAAPDPEGPKTRYSSEHLTRLLAIKRLQAVHLPLAEIRQLLTSLGPEQVAQVAAASNPQAGAAIDYIRSVLGDEPETLISTPPAPGPWIANPALQWPRIGDLKLSWSVTAKPPAAEPGATGPMPTLEPGSTRSQWDRISLDPDVELHVRRPLTRQNTKRVERLITIARQLFEED